MTRRGGGGALYVPGWIELPDTLAPVGVAAADGDSSTAAAGSADFTFCGWFAFFHEPPSGARTILKLSAADEGGGNARSIEVAIGRQDCAGDPDACPFVFVLTVTNGAGTFTRHSAQGIGDYEGVGELGGGCTYGALADGGKPPRMCHLAVTVGTNPLPPYQDTMALYVNGAFDSALGGVDLLPARGEYGANTLGPFRGFAYDARVYNAVLTDFTSTLDGMFPFPSIAPTTSPSASPSEAPVRRLPKGLFGKLAAQRFTGYYDGDVTSSVFSAPDGAPGHMFGDERDSLGGEEAYSYKLTGYFYPPKTAKYSFKAEAQVNSLDLCSDDGILAKCKASQELSKGDNGCEAYSEGWTAGDYTLHDDVGLRHPKACHGCGVVDQNYAACSMATCKALCSDLYDGSTDNRRACEADARATAISTMQNTAIVATRRMCMLTRQILPITLLTRGRLC